MQQTGWAVDGLAGHPSQARTNAENMQRVEKQEQ